MVFAVVLTAVLPMSIVASDRFADVPPGGFHDNINAIAEAGITGGCGGGNYCPDQAVTRGQMAAFMHRSDSRVAYATSATAKTLSNSATDIETLTINVGGVPGQTQFVKLDATFTLYVPSGTCPCRAHFRLVRDGGGSTPAVHYAQVDQIGSMDSGAHTWVVAVPTDTIQTFHLQGTIWSGSGTLSAWGSITAITAPFGSTGGNTLSEGGVQAVPEAGTPANP